jgi:hypothetical protein
MHFLAPECTKHGVDLKEVRVVSDDKAAIIGALNALRGGLGRIPGIAQESEENETLQFGRNEIEDSLIIAALATLYVVGLVKLGFLVPSAILLGIAMYCTGYRRLLPIVGISIGFPALLEYLLWYVLKVPLPQFPLIVF